ncbi:histidine phosphatase family protein [Glutamicibacter sp. MNS18]|uniref:histidine phosphatase family protein n=1 Tax=Glutamicibacter sp. MNS18 TaxID=2989817 RepID=UPI00223672EA|nr:histidine phosphatase family protein [Glutamicibacter sp. MNS18]MCW4465557.1 histidine phosphatase family protein [Glutamicibacter sp. MNS18]
MSEERDTDQVLNKPEERWVLVRHGQTAWNLDNRLQGRSDVRLNATGRQQAERAGVQLAKEGPWDLVVCSPLGRARQTAQIIADYLGIWQVLEVEGLVERDYGAAEGRYLDRISPEERERLLAGGEAEDDVVVRAVDALRTLVEQNPDSRVVIVAHGTLIRLVLGALAESPHPRVENGEVLVLDTRRLHEFVQR